MGKKSKKGTKTANGDLKPIEPVADVIAEVVEPDVTQDRISDSPTLSNSCEIAIPEPIENNVLANHLDSNQETPALLDHELPQRDQSGESQLTAGSETIVGNDVESENKSEDPKIDLAGFNQEWEIKLEDIKLQHLQEKDSYQAQVLKLKSELAESEKQRASTAESYQTLVERVSTIKATLGNKLKSDAAELAKSKQLIVELQEDNEKLHETKQSLVSEFTELNNENNRLSKELSQLRSHFNSSQDAWERERKSQELELGKANADAKRAQDEAQQAIEEAERARQSLGDLEIAMFEENSIRETYNNKIIELEELLLNQTFSIQSLTAERDNAVAKNAVLEESHEKQLSDYANQVETLTSQNNQLNDTIAELKSSDAKSKADFENQRLECEALRGQGNELKEKNLLIGKLRHEAVILNEHLTKALRMIKNNSDGGVVDTQLITNLFLSFLEIPRGDTKKFEVLQLISNLLGWDEEQKAQAGLTRGINHLSLRTPPVTPSKGSFNGNGSDETVTSAGGFVRRFAEFLERESSREKK